MSEIPTGTVTFLFTDINGSTQLWEKHPQAMRAVLARHDELLRSVFYSCGGHVFKQMGDAVYAAFANAGDAVNAAIEAQHALKREDFSSVGQLLVRMALHSGAAQHRDGDYFGPALNRVSRLVNVGHGGQILLSQSTAELVKDDLHGGVSLSDLGEKRLRDLVLPERIYQVNAPGLPADFPPLRTLDQLPNNLPQQVTSFIGREREMADVKRLLTASRLVTLVGFGGCGKTRLALQTAAEVVEQFPEGVWLIELASLADLRLVAQAVATAISIPEDPSRPMLEAIVRHLKRRACLIILDNCEHVISAAAELAEALLRNTTQVRILATSREPLEIMGETTWRVPTLPLPDERSAASLDRLKEFEAVRLFIDRATAARPSFALTEHNAPAVIQICRRVDGIPLAIELAAARVRALPVEQIADRLDDAFRLLRGGSRTALPRQQTLEALIAWSYDLLSEPEKVLCRRCSIFAGSFSLDLAEAVVAFDPLDNADVLDLASQLVNKSLVILDDEGDDVRYRMLGTIREFGRSRLEAGNELDDLRARHANALLDLAQRIEPLLISSRQRDGLAQVATAEDDLRAALQHFLDTANRTSAARICAAIATYWEVRGRLAEARNWLEEALLSESTLPDSLRADCLRAAGHFAFRQGDYVTAARRLDAAHTLARALEDPQRLANTLLSMGSLAWSQGDLRKSKQLYQSALEASRNANFYRMTARLLNNLGVVNKQLGLLAEARNCYEQAIDANRAAGEPYASCIPLINLASLCYAEGDFDAARRLCSEYMPIVEELKDRVGIAEGQLVLARIAACEADYARAESLLDNALTHYRDIGSKAQQAEALAEIGLLALRKQQYTPARRPLRDSLAICAELQSFKLVPTLLEAWAAILLAEDLPDQACILFHAAAALRETSGESILPVKEEEYIALHNSIENALPPFIFKRLEAQGRAMTRQQAIDLAMRYAPQDRVTASTDFI